MNSRSAQEDKMFDRIAALLVKAESTEFPAEAEAFAAEAQRLMARHSIDLATLQARSPGAFAPARKIIRVPDPYWRSKGTLLSAIARANRCKSIWLTHEHQIELFGAEQDIANAQTIFTTLLIHATRVMGAAGPVVDQWGENRTRSYRKSFLDGFAAQVNLRLFQARTEAEAEQQAEHGSGFLPVLLRTQEAVEAAVAEAYPALGRIRSSSPSNLDGYRAGVVAGSSADLAARRRFSA